MSIEAVDWALKVPIGGNAKVVLIGVANHAHPDGTESYPSLGKLAEYAYCDQRTVRRQMRKLEGLGLITPYGKSEFGTTKYRLELGQNVPDNLSAPDTGVRQTVPNKPGVQRENQEEEQPSLSMPVVAGVRPSDEWSYRGRKVPKDVADHALHLLAIFNAHTGKNLKPFSHDGRPSPHLIEITGAVLDHDDVSTDDWAAAIIRVVRDPWLPNGGRITAVGQIFGPRVVDTCLDPEYVGKTGGLSDREQMMRELAS